MRIFVRISYPHSPRPYFFLFFFSEQTACHQSDYWELFFSLVPFVWTSILLAQTVWILHFLNLNISNLLNKLSNLKWFYHRFCLINLHLLSSFRLWGCKLSETSCDYLFKALQSNTHLRELDLTLNNLQESHVKQLSELVDSPHHTLEVLKWVEAWTQSRLLSQYNTVWNQWSSVSCTSAVFLTQWGCKKRTVAGFNIRQKDNRHPIKWHRSLWSCVWVDVTITNVHIYRE